MPTTLTSQNITAIQFKESASPGTPASGFGRIYEDTSGVFHTINDAGTDVPITTFSGDITGAFLLSGVISPSALGADTNDWNPTGLSGASTLRASTSANYALTSLDGASSGRIIIIHNVGSNDLQIKTDDGATGTAAMRFLMTAHLRLLPNTAAAFRYDGTTSRWRCIAKTGFYAGEIVQEKSVVKTSVFTSSSGSFTDITDLTLSITPRSSTSIIEIAAMVAGSGDSGGGGIFATRMVRDSTAILIGDSAGSRTQASTYGAIVNVISQPIIGTDSPATTSATTYKVQGVVLNAGAGFAINKSYSSDVDLASNARMASSITVREICQ